MRTNCLMEHPIPIYLFPKPWPLDNVAIWVPIVWLEFSAQHRLRSTGNCPWICFAFPNKSTKRKFCKTNAIKVNAYIGIVDNLTDLVGIFYYFVRRIKCRKYLQENRPTNFARSTCVPKASMSPIECGHRHKPQKN